MRRFLSGAVAAVLVGLCIGQGCPGLNPEPVIGPTDVTDELRAACFQDTDEDIHAFLVLVDAARQQGRTKLESLIIFAQAVCPNGGADCNRCVTETVEHVYTH